MWICSRNMNRCQAWCWKMWIWGTLILALCTRPSSRTWRPTDPVGHNLTLRSTCWTMTMLTRCYNGELIVYIWWLSTNEQLLQFRRTRRQKQNGFHLSMRRSPKLNVSRFQIIALSWTTSWPGYLSGWCRTRPPGEERRLLLRPIINCSLFTFLTKSIFLTT